MVARSFLSGGFAVLFGLLWLAAGGAAAALPSASEVAKGHVANGELADYARGKIELDLLLRDYRSYGLPLPERGAELVALPREIWVIEPMRVWHLAFPLPVDEGAAELAGRTRQYLVGGEIFTSGLSTIRAMDERRADGSLRKAEQFEPGHLVDRWDGEELDAVDFIFHGQDKSDLDTNALFMTALQLHHLGDPRAPDLMRESLRFDVDIWDYWESDFVQPAGWTPRQILAECAWRTWVNRWYRGEEVGDEIVGRLRSIWPQLAVSSRPAAESLLGQIDPRLAGQAGDGSLGAAVIEFGLEGGEWSALVARARGEADAFELLVAMLEDERVFPFREGARRDFERRLENGRRLPVWYPRDRYRRVCDYAGMLLDEICDGELSGTNWAASSAFLERYAARAKFWRECSQHADPGAEVRSNWFVQRDGVRYLNWPALELQANRDLETLVADLPAELGIIGRDGLDDLTKVVVYAAEKFRAEQDWSKASAEERQRFRALEEGLFTQLYEQSVGNAAEVRAVLLRTAIPYERWSGDPEDERKLVGAALRVIRDLPAEFREPYARGEAALVGELPTRCRDDRLWEAILKATREVPPGLAIEWIGRLMGEKPFSDHPSRDHQFRFGFALLEDRRLRQIEVEPWRHEGARAAGFRRLHVGDYAAWHLGRKLGLPWVPETTWDDARWEWFRGQVRAAVLRLDAQRYRGLIHRR